MSPTMTDVVENIEIKKRNLASIYFNTQKYPFIKEKLPFIEATLDNFHKKTNFNFEIWTS
jgi:hypothetical protein